VEIEHSIVQRVIAASLCQHHLPSRYSMSVSVVQDTWASIADSISRTSEI
jgi:hypothetical protein